MEISQAGFQLRGSGQLGIQLKLQAEMGDAGVSGAWDGPQNGSGGCWICVFFVE